MPFVGEMSANSSGHHGDGRRYGRGSFRELLCVTECWHLHAKCWALIVLTAHSSLDFSVNPHLSCRTALESNRTRTRRKACDVVEVLESGNSLRRRGEIGVGEIGLQEIGLGEVDSGAMARIELPSEGPVEQGRPLPAPFYWPLDEKLSEQRRAARDKLRRYNLTGLSSLPTADLEAERTSILQELLGKMNPERPPFIEPPFNCDYGSNIDLGADCYMNFGCVILDCAAVRVGDNVLFGPNVHIYCPGHPLDPALRNGLQGPEFGLPVTVGNDVWIGGGAILLPGVTVGDGAVVGAGAVVTKDVPPLVVVAGNPAKVVRKIQKGDWGCRNGAASSS